MQRTISAMVGKGSVNHNSRKFKAANVDGERSHLNIDYCNEDIKKVYHKLFDEALARHNAKQTRADRKIENYYEKIRSGKQEKPFHEIILQIGDKDNMSRLLRTDSLLRRYWMSTIGVFRSVIRTCAFSQRISIWTRLLLIYTLTLCRSPPGASVGLIQGYR